MKKLFVILSFLLISGIHAFSQENDADGNDKIRDKMREFIQQRLNLTRNEAERFTPIFLRYFKEWRSTIRDYRNDRIMLQKRVAEVQLQYRDQFKEIIGEKRSNEVYIQQQVFIKELQAIRKERLQERGLPQRNRSMLQ